MISHESTIHPPDSGRATKHDPAKVKLPPYHPDTKDIRHDWARYYDVIERMDAWVGEKLKELEDAGLADNTIVIYYSDHGGILARSKRYLYETGLRIPFIIRIPGKYKYLYPASQPGSKVDHLIRLIDLFPTTLSMVGIKTLPAHLQGQAFLGPLKAPEPKYVYSVRGRMDERIDMRRSVNDKHYRYIRNYYPYRSNGIYNNYMWRALSTRSWQDACLSGNCNAAQAMYFMPKPVEELYDIQKDPWEVNNLAANPAYKNILLKMRAENNRWIESIRDAGFFPEGEIKKISDKQPMYDYMRSGKQSMDELIAVSDLAGFATVKDVPKLVQALKNKNDVVRYWAACGLLQLGDKARQAAPGLKLALTDSSPDVAITAAEALYRQGYKSESLHTLLQALNNPQVMVQVHALNVIDNNCRQEPSAVKAVTEVWEKQGEKKNEYVSRMVEWILNKPAQ